MNNYDHEDAFNSANIFAGGRTKLAEALKLATDKCQASKIIEDAQRQYENLFDAFIEGVDYGRKHPKPKQPTQKGGEG